MDFCWSVTNQKAAYLSRMLLHYEGVLSLLVQKRHSYMCRVGLLNHELSYVWLTKGKIRVEANLYWIPYVLIINIGLVSGWWVFWESIFNLIRGVFVAVRLTQVKVDTCWSVIYPLIRTDIDKYIPCARYIIFSFEGGKILFIDTDDWLM